MKVLFIISSSETAFWLSEVSHPYWHFTERGVEVDFASPNGGKIVYDQYSDPYFEKSLEPEDLVSKGFLSDEKVQAKLENTLKLEDVDLTQYDAIHVAGGRGATFDLYPNEHVAKALEYFWEKDKVVGAICHGAVALGNIPGRIKGRQVTGFTLEADKQLQALFGAGFVIPHYPQTVLESSRRCLQQRPALHAEGHRRWEVDHRTGSVCGFGIRTRFPTPDDWTFACNVRVSLQRTM